jgi:hypothetical protein
MRAVLVLTVCIVATGAALAQPRPGDSVTVTGAKDRETINRFIETFAAPTYVLGKLSRWERGVCPVAVGLRPAAVKFVVERLRATALEVGAPVNERRNCTPNIEIVVTTSPQGLMDNVRRKHAAYLGYASTLSKADKLAIVTHPIQAWYTTAGKDVRGRVKIDNARTIGLGDSNELAAAIGFGGNVTGMHIQDGRASTLYHVIIAVDPAKLLEHEIGGVADYISFLALSQLASLDRCQQLASIVNMMVPNCPAVAREMTQNDLAFLRGLYRMPLDSNLRMQKDWIGYEMTKALQGR